MVPDSRGNSYHYFKSVELILSLQNGVQYLRVNQEGSRNFNCGHDECNSYGIIELGVKSYSKGAIYNHAKIDCNFGFIKN